MLNTDLPRALVGGGDSFDHFHSSDRTPTHDTLQALHELDTKRTVPSSPYMVLESDDLLFCAAGEVINFPRSRGNGREIEVIMTGVAPVTVNLFGGDTVCGENCVILEVQWTALRFKSVAGGWVLI